MNELDSITNGVLLSLPCEYETVIEDMGDGSVAIRQKDPMGGGDDFVLLSKSQAVHVYMALRTFAESN